MTSIFDFYKELFTAETIIPLILVSLVAIALRVLTPVYRNFENRFAEYLVEQLTKLVFRKPVSKKISYSAQLTSLTESLNKSSAEVDNLLNELSEVAQDRQKTLQGLESELLRLENRQTELSQRIKDLENVPIPVAEHFAKLTESLSESSEKRSAQRDYILFVLGLILGTVLSVITTILLK